MKKQVYLEAIRGLAALIVVFDHFFAAFYPATLFGPFPTIPSLQPWQNLFNHTPLCLLIAGDFALCLFLHLERLRAQSAPTASAVRPKG